MKNTKMTMLFLAILTMLLGASNIFGATITQSFTIAPATTDIVQGPASTATFNNFLDGSRIFSRRHSE